MNKSGQKRSSKPGPGVPPYFLVGHTIAVYDSRKHLPIYISEDMVGHKLGNLTNTHFCGHGSHTEGPLLKIRQ